MTRPADGAAETARLLDGMGFEAVAAPLLRIATGRLAPLERGVVPQAVIVTSGHALPALDPWRERFGVLPLFAVGDATAASARVHGWRDSRSAGGDSAALAEHVAASLRPEGGVLLLASGKGNGLALAASLRGRGFRVIRRAVYAARTADAFPPEAVGAIERGMHAALFLSRSASLPFGRLVPAPLAPLLGRSFALAISEATAAPVRRLPWRALRVAVRPTLEDVLALL